MEDRDNHLVTWRSITAVGGALLCFSSAFAANCDSSLANAPAVYQVSVPIRGQNPVRNTFTVADTTQLLVLAQEHGADVTLEVLDSSGQVLARGDNPVRRIGVQRIA